MGTRKANNISSSSMQYHIACKAGDIAKNIILVGDPQRAFRISTQFDKIRFRMQHREYVTFTGTYKGIPITVMATGIGQGNMEIAMVELAQIIKKPTIIRCGTSSGLQKNIRLGSLVISRGVHDLGNLAIYYKISKSKVKGNPKVERALVQACDEMGVTSHVGTTASAPGFYGPQGRKAKGFPISKPNIIKTLIKKKVMNLEMEVATMFALASAVKIPVGAICGAIGNRARNDFMDDQGIMKTEQRCIAAVLKAFEILNRSNRK